MREHCWKFSVGEILSTEIIAYHIAIFFSHFTFISPDLPENEATYAITEGGIADAKE